jgi:branched-chain amino acid transport system permease protein
MSELKISPALGPPAGLGAMPMATFWDALALRVRANRAFYVSLGLYALFAIIGLGTGLLHSDILVRSGIFFILVLGLDLLFGLGGMLSFAHIGFFSIAAYTVAVLNVSYGVNIWLAAVAGIALNVLMSYGLGLICLRLSGSYFILGTLAFGLMIHSVIVVAYPITGGDAGIGGIARPQIAGLTLASDLLFGAVVWIIAAMLLWCSLSLTHSRAGRALKAMRGDAVAAACLGIEEARLRTNIFVLSAVFASIGGALYSSYFEAVHPDSFGLGVLVDVLLMLFLGGYGSIWGGLIGATFITVLPDLQTWLNAGKELFDGILFAVIILAFPRGIAGAIEQLASRFVPADAAHSSRAGRLAGRSLARRSAVLEPSAKADHCGDAALAVRHLGKRFGGVNAVDDVSFQVTPGTLKGLIGPNGAGKSTMINLITGILPPSAGTVSLGDKLLTGLRPDQIARIGIMRTFQHERLFADLNVVENVMVGYEHGIRGTWRELFQSAVGVRTWAQEESDGRRVALAWLDLLGLDQRADDEVETLPNGLRKLVEVARACAASPIVLLLDETAAGLNETERLAFRDIIKRLRRSGMTIILIEHDLELVMELSDDICVLNFGQKIAEGTPEQVRNSEQVVSAYLGA